MRWLAVVLAVGLGGWYILGNGTWSSTGNQVTDDGVVAVSAADTEMNAAMQKARDTLPAFWSKIAKPATDEEGFALKLGISDKGEVEHFWCIEIQGTADRASCVINNEPVTVKTVAIGQRIQVDSAIISDWMYLKQGKIKGGQTIRALIPKLSQEEADATRAMLADE